MNVCRVYATYVVILFASLLYTRPRFRCLFLPLATSSGSAFLRYLFHDTTEPSQWQTALAVKKIHTRRVSRGGIAAFIAFQGLLALARGETRAFSSRISIRFIIYLHFLRSAGTTSVLRSPLPCRMCKYSDG